MRVTIKDVAEKAQVSVTTVSMAMGSPGRIAEATRERVLKVAEEMGYRPNMLVRGMQKGQTMSVGVLMNFSGDSFEGRIFQGVHHTLVDAGYVPIALMPNDRAPALSQIHSLLDRRVDGILMRPTGEAKWEEHLHEALRRHVPVVSVDSETVGESGKSERQIDFVGTDDYLGGKIAATKMLEAGHRRLAVLSMGDETDPMYQRCKGFVDTLKTVADTTCEVVDLSWEYVHSESPELAMKLLGSESRPTGVFLTMDMIAPGVYRAAASLGLNLPDDLSVIGFADEAVAHYLTPSLSTLRQHPREIGQHGAELLLKRIEMFRKSKKTPVFERTIKLLEPTWVERDSVTAPPA
ncbi:LacI family DNA-binding transcriptional regulator [Algisphaera agarilytica]|uniref:DNA-binding LacI/PurR family transcriptional regulator n=1 Tax=Algisphaera agarilytica TaxID=1385975 RepID=A0A7X0H6M4_9BACT|nr:LacI family DNA-binding transcriptional regulator [Algisphaera agarilytica]MBB6430253.1 DNA-binding LacI/PurR family transcriptional regulator [Algisphaera agarilytica]